MVEYFFFFCSALKLSLWFKSQLFFLIRAAGRRLCPRVRINADRPVPLPGCADSLRRPCNLSHAAKVHVRQSPLSCSPFTRGFLLRAVTTPWKHIFSVDTGSYQPRRQAGDVKVKFMSSGTWFSSGTFGFGVSARQAVLTPSMGNEPAWGQAQKLLTASPSSSHWDGSSPGNV